jgi:hypothetical protein
MFATRFAKEGVLNPKTGADYRRCILEKGAALISLFLSSSEPNFSVADPRHFGTDLDPRIRASG